MAIILSDRDTKPAETNIPRNENSAFRAMGKEGADDLMRSGVARNNPANNFAGEPLYASKEAPLQRYVNGNSGKAVLEFEPSESATTASGKNHVRETQLPNRYTDKVRVWEQQSPGNYSVAYDNFNPAKRAARTIGAGVVAPATVLAIPEAVGKGMLRLAADGKQPNLSDSLVDLGSAVTGGIIADAGPVPQFKYDDEGNWTPKHSQEALDRAEFSRAFNEGGAKK